MYKVQWTLAFLVGLVAACGAPGTAIAPSHAPLAESAGLRLRPITTIAALMLEPLELRGLVAQPFAMVRSEGGEQRARQILVGVDGVEVLRVESALDGSLRLIAKSDVALGGDGLSESSAIARALRHLVRLGLGIPVGGPTVQSAAGRTLVIWTREVRGVPVVGDGTRVVLNGTGALVGISIEESPLAALPARVARADAAIRAAVALLPSDATVGSDPELAWVFPPSAFGEGEGSRTPRRLAWRVGGALRDGAPFELQLDAGSLVLIGWDGAP